MGADGAAGRCAVVRAVGAQLPGSMIVNMAGKRIMNESMPYVEACHNMYGGQWGQGDGPGENVPAWLVFDQRYRNRYIFAGLTRATHSEEVARDRSHREGGHDGGTCGEGRAAGRRAEGDGRTLQRVRPLAVSTRTSTAAKAPTTATTVIRPTSNPNLGEINNPPYYAAKMVPGDLGTKGGIRTDVHGRALRDDGRMIEGLYAAGNLSAPVMGHTYAGPGGTIGPAMTFGYLAALHIAGKA